MTRLMFLAASSLVLLPGCGSKIPLEAGLNADLSKQVTDAIGAINEFNRVADRTPENLRAAADKVIDKLKFEGRDFLAYDARLFADHTLGSLNAVAATFLTHADEKMKAYLVALKNALEEALPKVKAEKSRDKAIELLRNIKIDVKPLDPFVGLVNPNKLSIRALQTHTGQTKGVEYKSPLILELSGFGLSRPEGEPTDFHIEVVGAKDVRVLPATVVSQSSPFLLLINLSHFAPAEGDQKMLVSWGKKKLADIPFETLVVKDAPPPEPVKPTPPPADIAGVLLDNGDGKVNFLIQHTGNQDQTTIVIRRSRKDMSWKKVVIKNERGDISSAQTEGDDDGKEMTLVAGNLVGDLKLAFGKSGFLGAWKGVHEPPVTKDGLLGKRITYTWERD